MNDQSRPSVPIAFLLFAVALALRILPFGSFVTVDEAYHWFDRAGRFLQALHQGNYAATNLIGHPGVTTLWLGAIGLEIHNTLLQMGIIVHDSAALTRMFLRAPVAVATSACLSIAYLLLYRLFGGRIALAAGILWATEPMLVAYSQLLHVDALLTSFISLSLLSALLAWRLNEQGGGGMPQPGWLAGSAVAGGLALLTKSPSLILLPMLGLIALVALMRAHGAGRTISLWSRCIAPLMIWAGLAALVWIALWPAAWVDLPTAVMSVAQQVEGDGGTPHAWGNYFMGEAVADPGPLFYPVVAALRSTPQLLIGLILAVTLFWRRPHAQGWPAIVVLLIFTVLFTLAISIPPKKFDRYLLPIFPALTIAAGWGFAQLLQLFPRLRWIYRGALAALIALTLYHSSPYAIAYYNPLLGGGRAAVTLIPVGWGEGFEQAGAYIRAQPDGDRPVATWYGPALQPFVRAGVTSMSDALIPGKVSYAVLYIDQVQRRDEPEVIDTLSARAPIHTIWINDIPYARIYKIPAAVEHEAAAGFGDQIELRGYSISSQEVRSTGALTLTLLWEPTRPVERDATLFVHILDQSGARIVGIDVPPTGPNMPTSGWRVGDFPLSVQRIALPPDLAPGRYWVTIGLYDPQSGQRLSLGGTPQDTRPTSGADSLTLDSFELK